MPWGISRYIFANVRIRAMLGRLLSDETWRELDQAADLMSMIQMLADTAYVLHVVGFEQVCPPCELLEARLNANLALGFARVIDLTPKPDRELVILLKQFYEVDNLKTLMRGIEIGEDPEKIKSFLFPLGRAASLDFQALAGMTSVTDLVEAVQHTPYGVTLAHALERYEAEQRLFPLEVALDLDYYRRLWQAVEDLPRDSIRWARLLIGTWYDITNILWALRYRHYHRLTMAEIINYTLPFGYRSNDALIRAIAGGADISSVLERAWGTSAPQVDTRADAWLPKLEIDLHRYHAGLARSALVGNPFQLGVILAYVILKRYEVQDLMVMAEAKMAGLPPAQYHRYMVHSFRPRAGE